MTKLSDQLRRDFIGKYDCPDAIVEIAADMLDECEKVLDLALWTDGHSTNRRIEATLDKLRAAQEKADDLATSHDKYYREWLDAQEKTN